MFSRSSKTQKTQKNQYNDVDTLVGSKTKILGDLQFTGGCHVDGQVEGRVLADMNSESTLFVSERGFVDGDVTVPDLELNGTVHGNVRVGHRLRLGTKARVIGDVYYNLIEMAIGSEVNGKLMHQSEVNERTAEEKPEETAEVVHVNSR
ncbi:MAG: polymer-forming cytoskeletal protein [Gammaproteobacteria bacterium]|nr:polymer-forming cytoskeletal protein [Gammaproteobacteria bacterium]